jgi:hypothetical protein
MTDFFTLDGGDMREPPPAPQTARAMSQPSLFPLYVDVQRKNAARYAEPSLMDFLGDNPK